MQSLNSLNDQIANFMVTGPKSVEQEEHAFPPPEKETLQKSMTLMRHLLVDAQVHRKKSTFVSLKEGRERLATHETVSRVASMRPSKAGLVLMPGPAPG